MRNGEQSIRSIFVSVSDTPFKNKKTSNPVVFLTIYIGE